MSQTEIHEIEMSIEEAKAIVERGLMAERLSKNPDFKKLVLDGYFRDEAARLVHLSTDITMDDRQKEAIQNDIKGVGGFKRFLSTAYQMGQYAANEIAEAREALDEIRHAELEEDDS